MRKTNIFLFLSFLNLFALFTIFLASQSFFAKEFNFSGLNFSNKSYAVPVSLKLPIVKYLVNKDVKISFQMKVDSVSNYDNIFQTAPVNSGIRMELGGASVNSLGLIIGNGKSTFKGFLLDKNISFNKWYSIFIHIDRNNRIVSCIDDKKVLDEVCDSLQYDLSDIVIGTGFSKTRPFNGEIRDFSISGKLFYRILPLCKALILYLFVGILFILSFLPIRKQAAGFWRLSRSQFDKAIVNLEEFFNHPYIQKHVSFLFSFILPVSLIFFSAVKIFFFPKFLESIIPLTGVYLSGILFSFSLLVCLLKRFKLLLLLFFVPLIVITAAGKLFALIALGLFLSASLMFGLFLCNVIDSKLPRLQKFCYAFICGIAANSYFIWGAMHFRINYPVIYFMFFIVQIIVFRKTALVYIKDALRKEYVRDLTSAQQILIFLMTVHVIYALVPNYCWDELVAHFYIPKVIALNGLFNFNPHYVPPFFNLSLVSLGAHSALFLTGGEAAMRLFHWAVFYSAFFIFEIFLRNEYGKKVSLFSTLTLATTPYFLWCLGCPFIDSLALLSAVIIFINVTNLLNHFTKRNILLFFLLSCCAVFFKLQSVFLIIPVAIIILFKAIYSFRKEGDAGYLWYFLIGGLSCIVFFLPIFLHNWVITRNPIFPMYNDIIKSPFFNIEKPLPGFFRFKDVTLRWDTLYDITFAGDKYYVGENNRFLFGISYFVFLWFLPLITFAREQRKHLAFSVWIFFCVVFLCYAITGLQMRYFITSAPLGALMIGWIMAKLLSLNRSFRIRSAVLAVVFGGSFFVNFVCQINNTFLPSPFPLKEALTGDYSGSPRLKEWERVKKFFEKIDERYGRHTKALLYYSPAMYFANFDIQVLDWYNQLTVLELIGTSGTIEDFYHRLFKEQKFDILIITDRRPATFLDEIIQRGMVRKDYSEPGYSVYKPEK